jgi:predicted transcriptional regulator
MGYPVGPAFVIRTFRISADGDQKLNFAALALRTPKSRLIEEAIALIVKRKKKEIQAGAQDVQRNLEASLAR